MTDRGAVLSDCGRFRYRLWRRWADAAPLPFVMLNPSTADANEDDPTIRKCIGFAQRLGYGGIEVVNLFAVRATKPADLKASGYQVGPDNDKHVAEVCAPSRPVVCAWGVNARGLSRPSAVLALMRLAGAVPHALKLTDDGIPWHPLMLPYSCQLQPLTVPPESERQRL